MRKSVCFDVSEMVQALKILQCTSTYSSKRSLNDDNFFSF